MPQQQQDNDLTQVLTQQTNSFLISLESLEHHLSTFTNSAYEQHLATLDPQQQALLHTTLAYTLATLVYLLERTHGLVNPTLNQELRRLHIYFDRIQRKNSKNAAVADRVVKHYIPKKQRLD